MTSSVERELWALTRDPVVREAPDLESIYRTHFDDVYRIVRHLLGPASAREDVDDVAQLVFIAVQKALPAFRGESKTSTWIYGIASRVVLMQLRGWRRQRRLKKALEEEQERFVGTRTPEQAVSDRQEALLVWSCLLRINPKKRIVYVLHEIEGLNGPEIAEILGVPEGTVWTRLHHARRELVAALEKKMKEVRR
jgi:RNA polymerase sigma-70 factor (ECF subfamily)